MAETPTRSLAVAVLSGLVCGAAMLLAASRTWSAVTVSTPGVPTDVVAVTGAEAVPLVSALALVVLAGSAAILPTSGAARRGIGAVLAVAGLTAAVAAAASGDEVKAALVDAVAGSPAATVPVAAGAVVRWWRWAAAAAGMAACAVGVATAGWGHTWTVMGRRYDAPGASEAAGDGDPWRVLDEGRDPTA